MQFKPVLRKSAELGIGLTAIAALTLAGCGGGGSAPAATTKSVTVTPGKGIMIGASVEIKDANGKSLGTAPTTSAGTAGVSIPATAVGPFIISVSCPATCQYFDEKTATMVAGSASAPPLLAVAPSAAVTNIGVTAATNAAAQYAIAAGTLTPASVIAANNIVITNLGLSGVTDLLTPPTIIKDTTTLAAAQAGTTPADKLANYSASIAIAASGVSAIQAIADYGDAWKQAAITPASGVVLPATINATTLAANAPTFTTTTIPNVASQVTAATTAAASAVAAVDSWIAELSVAGNSNGWWEQTYSANAAAQASGVMTTDVHAFSDNVTVSGNTATFSGTDLKLVNGAWVTDTDRNVNYHLTSTGWVMGANSGKGVNNLDGTVTITPTGGDPSVETIIRTDLAGKPIPCYNATCNGTATYPAGSVYTSSLATVQADQYQVSSGSKQFPSKVTDMSGVALTALPTAGASFCVQQGPGAQIFVPITPAPAAGDNYNVFGAWSCSATELQNQSAYIAGGGTPMGTVTLGTKTIAGVTVGLATATAATSVTWINDAILAVVAGQVYPGWRTPAGNVGFIQSLNKIAVNAELAANGHPALH